MIGQTGRVAVGAGVALATSCVLWLNFSSPFSLAEFCTRRHPTWVFGLFDSPRYTAVTGPAFLATLLALAALYGIGLWAARRLEHPLAVPLLIVVAPVLFAAVLLPGYPLLSNDIFKYVFDGRILAVYHDNPFVRVPSDYPDDRFYDLVYWKAVVNAHGPLWRVFEAASAQVGSESCVRSVVAMKVWPVLAYGGTTAALFLLLSRLLPGQAVFATIVFAWNPLVLLEALQNGHNDVVAALPTLLAVWAAWGGRWRLAFPLLAIGFLVKPLAALAGPVVLVAAWRAGPTARREALIGGALASVVVVLAYLPFFGGSATLQGLERGDLFSASPAELLMNGLVAAGWTLGAAMAVSRVVTNGVFGVLVVGLLLRASRGAISVAATAAACFFVYLVVGAQWFNPWYLLWLLPLAVLAWEPRLLSTAVVFSVLAPLIYLLQYEAQLVVPLVFVPTALLALALLIRSRTGRPFEAASQPPLAVPGAARHG
jgi:alpha-1,6-mannosyltransferase